MGAPLRKDNPIVDDLRCFRPEPHYSVTAVAKALDVHPSTIYDAIANRRLIAICAGGKWRISQTAIDQYVRLLPDKSHCIAARDRNRSIVRNRANRPQRVPVVAKSTTPPEP